MKTPSFWYDPPGLLADLLQPLDVFYRYVPLARRALTASYKPRVPLICVGNIVAGGAGKTPTAMALAAILLAQGSKPAFVTRGYGGKIEGPMRVDVASHSADDVGDEALLLARTAPTWVSRNRRRGVIEAEKSATHVILDDGLQNPSVSPTTSFLVVDAASELGNGHVIPAGPLREPLHEALKRVHAVIALGGIFTSELLQEIKLFNLPILSAEVVIDANFVVTPTKPYVAFAGIARPEKFYKTCRQGGLHLAATLDFPDHHLFRSDDVARLHQLADQHQASLITTEKDWVRLPKDVARGIGALPVTLRFANPAALSGLLDRRP